MTNINNNQTFKGIIIAENWNSAGEIIQVSLLTHQEKEYMIRMDKAGKELIPYCQHTVEINGKHIVELNGSSDKHDVLVVTSFNKVSTKL